MRPVYRHTITGNTTAISAEMGEATFRVTFHDDNRAMLTVSQDGMYESIAENVNLDQLRMIVSMLTSVVEHLEGAS